MTLVWQEKTEIPEWARDTQEPHKVLLQSSQSVFHRPGKVTMFHSNKYTGLNKHSGNRWYRWENVSAIGFRVNNNGTILPYTMRFIAPDSYTGRKGFWKVGSPGEAFFPFENTRFGHSTIHDVFVKHVKEEFGITALYDVYPVAKMYDIDAYHGMPSPLRNAMREQDFKAFVARVYGKSRLRKDLVKATAATIPASVAYAQQFRGFVPTDWIINFLRQENTGGAIKGDFRFLLRQMDPRSYKHLISRPFRMNDYQILDELIMAHASPFREMAPLDGELFRTWADVHDKTLPPRAYSARIKFENTPVKLVKQAKALHEFKFDNYKIVCATETDHMASWGEYMRNCIGSYHQIAVNGGGIYGAVHEDSKMIANFELRKVDPTPGAVTQWELKQLLGKANSLVPIEKRTCIEAALMANGVNIPSMYWGSERDMF